MYHYKESGLPHVYLCNGYRQVDTPYGRSVVIQDLEALHFAIAASIIERSHLTGPEVRFIRKFLEKTQLQLADLLGVEEQSVRRWEKLPRVPKAADRAVRLLFLDSIREGKPRLPHIGEIIAHAATHPDPGKVNLRFKPRSKEKWQPQDCVAA